jgi:hypothetical protein
MTPQILGTSRRRKSRINTDPDLIERINRTVDPEEKKPTPDKSNKNKDLSGRLDIDETGKPILELTPLRKTVVNTPTPEGYDLLMQVYECGGWVWYGIDMPTNRSYWGDEQITTCVEANESVMFDFKQYYQEAGYDIISLQEFYNRQNITSDTLAEINTWFETNKPNRESKG